MPKLTTLKSNFSALFVAVALFFILLPAYSQQQLYVSPDGKLIYYLSYDKSTYSSRLFVSNDNGKSFADVAVVNKLLLLSIGGLHEKNDVIYAGGYENSLAIDAASHKIDQLATDNEDFMAASLDAVYITQNDKKIYLGGDDSDDNNSWLFIGTKNYSSSAELKRSWVDTYVGECGSEGYGTLNINVISGKGDLVYLASTTFGMHAPGICISKDQGMHWQMLKSFPEHNSSAVYAVPDTNIVYASGFSEAANEELNFNLYVSDNGGASWRKTLFVSKYGSPYISAITGSNDGKVIYVAGESHDAIAGGIWIKDRQDAGFSKVIFPGQKNYSISSIACSQDGSVVAALGYSDSGDGANRQQVVWLSSDSGKQWHSYRCP